MTVTRFTHSILFFFALGLALLTSSVLMLFLNETWENPGFVSLVVTALIVSVVVPTLAALLSLRVIRWRQPLTAWLVFFVISLLMTLIIGNSLLG